MLTVVTRQETFLDAETFPPGSPGLYSRIWKDGCIPKALHEMRHDRSGKLRSVNLMAIWTDRKWGCRGFPKGRHTNFDMDVRVLEGDDREK